VTDGVLLDPVGSVRLGLRQWGGKDVLDFGGNIGNMLRDPQPTIDEERYWCIDVIREAVEKGRLLYPKARWLFYDRYNFAFNPGGVPGLSIPEPGRRFDVIVAFTSTPRNEMVELMGQLRAFLKDDGSWRSRSSIPTSTRGRAGTTGVT
jgi:hypothetical protein